MGVEVVKARILARHSGEAILRYVADAPLKSLPADLGLASSAASSSSSAAPFGPGGSLATSALVPARVRKLEAAMAALEDTVQAQARGLVGVASGFARPGDRVFVQNTATATIHQAKAHDGGHTMCGWRFLGARKRGAAPFQDGAVPRKTARQYYMRAMRADRKGTRT